MSPPAAGIAIFEPKKGVPGRLSSSDGELSALTYQSGNRYKLDKKKQPLKINTELRPCVTRCYHKPKTR